MLSNLFLPKTSQQISVKMYRKGKKWEMGLLSAVIFDTAVHGF